MKKLFLSLFFATLVLAEKDHKISRRKRQTLFSFNPGPIINPQFFQYNGLVPITASQTNTARCQALAGRAALNGCNWVPVIVDANGLPLNCREECFDAPIIPFQLQPIAGTFGPPLNPAYLTNNQFTVVDQSNLDNFAGNSYFVFTPATTTTAPVVATTTTAASATITATTVGTATTVTVPTVTTPTVRPVTPNPDANIDSCIAAGQTPDPGCSFDGSGSTVAGAVTCGQVCPLDPTGTISGKCDPNAGTHIEKCLCVNGSPPSGCSYKISGSDNPLTCARACKFTPIPGGGG